ncbi:MAG: ATP-binding protein [Candidatus Hodarchaeota archaeon]
MSYRRLSPKIIGIFVLVALLPLIIGTSIGVHLMLQTSNQASDVARDALFTTAQGELSTIVHLEADKLNSFFSSYEEVMIKIRGYVEYLLQTPIIDSRWNDSVIVETSNGSKGLATDIGLGDIFIPSYVNLTASINQTLRLLSSLGSYFHPLVESPDVLLAGVATEQQITRLFPYQGLVNFLPPNFNMTERPWYQAASTILQTSNHSAWSIYRDFFTDALIATASIPFFNGSELFGVIAMDISLEFISQAISKIHYRESGYAVLLAETLDIFARSNISSSTSSYDEFFASNNATTLNPDLYEKLQQAMANETGQFVTVLQTSGIQNITVEKLIFYEKLKIVNLLLCIVVETSEIVSISNEIVQIWENSAGQFLFSGLLLVISLLVIAIIISFLIFGISVWRYTVPQVDLFLAEKRRANILFDLIGHDLRNALQSQLLAMEVLSQEKTFPDTRETAIFKNSYQKIEKIGNLIRQMGELRFLNRKFLLSNLMYLAEECQEVCQQLRSEYASISIEFTNKSSKPLVCVYNPLLQNALIEIARNGIIHNRSPAKRIHIILESASFSKMARIMIVDNGIHIPPDNKKILQDPLKHIGTRTGLGYVILKSATDLAGGYYIIRDRKDNTIGTRVIINLPVINPEKIS